MAKNKVFMCWTLNSGTTFYRMMNFVKYARKHMSFGMSKWRPDMEGVADWEYKMSDEQVRKDLSVLIDNCDLTIAQKFHSIGGLSVIDAFRHKYPNKPFYSEFDDNVFAVNPCSAAYENYNPGSELEKIAEEQIMLSTGLIVSTEYLRRTYESINPNIWVVPNAIDFDIWDNLKEKPRKSKKIRIGWAGGGSHVDDLDFIYPAIDKIRKKYSNVEFMFLGGVPSNFEDTRRLKLLRKWYPIDRYPQGIKDMDLDIALAPLRDNDFNRAKSNLRWLEYSALKVPTVASNVEPFKCINNGVDGVLAVEVDEWVEAISELIEDDKKRKKIGSTAHKRVKADYNAEKVSLDYVKKMRSMIAGKYNISKESVISALV